MNGKALHNGIKLGEMGATDMLDVLHFYFEEDNTYTTAEQVESQTKLREGIYSNMYNKTYKWAKKTSQSSNTRNYQYEYDPTEDGFMSEAESVKPFSPQDLPQKPALGYDSITPMDIDSVDPFGGILDAPLSH